MSISYRHLSYEAAFKAAGKCGELFKCPAWVEPCPNCGYWLVKTIAKSWRGRSWVYTETPHIDTDCARNRRRASRNPGDPFWVVATGISRHYGGPEEGGWWYDHTRVLSDVQVTSVREGLAVARAMREEYPTCPRGRFSAIGGEDVYIQCHYDETEFQYDDEEKPSYE